MNTQRSFWRRHFANSQRLSKANKQRLGSALLAASLLAGPAATLPGARAQEAPPTPPATPAQATPPADAQAPAVPALATPAPPSTPSGTTEPVPVDKLPPLNLPDMPGEDGPGPGREEARPDIPPTPPPLPMPTGPAVVKAGIQPTGERHYKIFYGGEWIGWSKFRVTGEMKLAQTDAVIISSTGEIRVGFGQPVQAKFESRLMLDRTTLRPAYYKCIQAVGDSGFEVECVYSETMVAQTNRTGDQRTVHFHNFTDQAPQLVFNNLWGHIDTFPEHYWIMVRSAVNGGIVPSYDPILRGGGDVVVYAPTTEEWTYDGRKVKTKLYPISDLKGTLLARVRVAADSFELLEVEEVGSGLRMLRTDAGIEKRLAGLKGVDLAKTHIVESNVVFPDPEQLTALEADVDIHLRGGQLADHRIAGYRQYFTGELREGVMKGRVFVRSVPREVPFDSPYPLEKKNVEADVVSMLEPGPGLETEYPPLATKARELCWKSPNSFEAAKRLNSYVYDIEEGVSLPSARYALESGVGNPESKALLLVAMSRAVGLPARKITGVAFRDGSFVPHHWAEIWLSKDIGWTPFDPSTGEAGRVGAAHIALLDSGDIQDLTIRVTDYAPRATKRVAYIAQELKWGTGERRTYGVYKDGVKVGTEVAEVGDIEVVDGEEVYHFNARSEVKGVAGSEITTAEQLLNPNGLPRKIVVNYKDAVKDESMTYTFGEDTVLVRPGKAGEEKFEKDKGREYPFAKGTYFTDPRLLTQWALMAGQVPLTEGSEKEFPIQAYLPDRKAARAINLEVGEVETIHLKPTLGLTSDKSKDTDKDADPSKEDGAEVTPEEGKTGEEAAPTAESTPAVSDDKAEAKPEGDAMPEGDAKASGEAKPDPAKPDEPKADDPKPDESGVVIPPPDSKPVEAITETRSTMEQLQALIPEDASAVRAVHLITDSGMEFWLNDKNQIIKIEIPDQGLELILEKVESSLD